MATTIMLVENHIIVREALSSLIDRQSDMKIVGQADSGQTASELAEKLKPNVIIMDVAMPDMNGIEATRLIKEKLPDTKVIALSAYDNREYVIGMAKAGVSGYLLKDCAFEELIKAVKTVMQGKSYLSPDITSIVLEFQAEKRDNAVKTVLNERDRQIVKLLAEGKTARQIAQQEGLSVKTIEGRRRKIMEKLKLNNAAGLVRYAMEEGFIASDRRY